MWLLHIRAASLTFKRLLLMNTRNLLCTIILPALLLLFTTAAFAQNKTVTGRVTDAAGAGAASVTVSAKGQNIATTTNESGQFSITVPQSVATLVFSSVGFRRVR